jgi:hypothetical protein
LLSRPLWGFFGIAIRLLRRRILDLISGELLTSRPCGRVLPDVKDRKSFLQLVRPTETFPLILSLGIVVQGITYAAAQARGLQSLSILGCESISELMLPGEFP